MANKALCLQLVECCGNEGGSNVEIVDNLNGNTPADREKALSAYQGWELDQKINNIGMNLNGIVVNEIPASWYVDGFTPREDIPSRYMIIGKMVFMTVYVCFSKREVWDVGEAIKLPESLAPIARQAGFGQLGVLGLERNTGQMFVKEGYVGFNSQNIEVQADYFTGEMFYFLK